jgi:hypothetical protein
MSVFNTKYDDDLQYGNAMEYDGKGRRCSCCNELVHYPYMHWEGFGDATGIFLCGECCLLYREHIVADMIHCAAIYEMQKLSGLGHWTLVRALTDTLEEQGKQEGKRPIQAVFNSGE